MMTQTGEMLARPTLQVEPPPAFLAASRQFSQLPEGGYPREVRPSEKLPYNPAQLHNALDRMGIARKI